MNQEENQVNYLLCIPVGPQCEEEEEERGEKESTPQLPLSRMGIGISKK